METNADPPFIFLPAGADTFRPLAEKVQITLPSPPGAAA